MKISTIAFLLPVVLATCAATIRADDSGSEVTTTTFTEFRRPERPDRAQTAPVIKEALEKMRQRRAEFIARHRELERQLKGATAEDRATIRQQMLENRTAFSEAKEEFHEDLKAVSEKLKDQVRKIGQERQSSSKRE